MVTPPCTALAPRPPRSPRQQSRGAAAVEAALVIPLLLTLLLGIIEMSLLMKDTVAVSSAVRVGGRMASTLANAGVGTCPTGATAPPCTPEQAPALAQAAADAIQKAGSAFPKDQIEKLTVFDANAKGAPKPEGNTDYSVCSTNCVVYVWDTTNNRFRYQSGAWRTNTVNACVNDPARQSVGVMLQGRHVWVTGLFGAGITLEEHIVMQFEPLPNDSCKNHT